MKKYIFITPIFFSIFVNAAGFDCALAKTPIEIMICNNNDISILDQRVSDLYHKCLDRDQGIKKDQRSWLKNVRNECKDSACLKDVYIERLYNFEKICAVEPASSIEVSSVNYLPDEKKPAAEKVVDKEDVNSHSSIKANQEGQLCVDEICIGQASTELIGMGWASDTRKISDPSPAFTKAVIYWKALIPSADEKAISAVSNYLGDRTFDDNMLSFINSHNQVCEFMTFQGALIKEKTRTFVRIAPDSDFVWRVVEIKKDYLDLPSDIQRDAYINAIKLKYPAWIESGRYGGRRDYTFADDLVSYEEPVN